jgi:hypothetical protein
MGNLRSGHSLRGFYTRSRSCGRPLALPPNGFRVVSNLAVNRGAGSADRSAARFYFRLLFACDNALAATDLAFAGV